MGAFLSNYYSTQRNTAERAIAERRNYRDTSITAIKDFSDVLYERHTWSAMLASSIDRRAPMEELKERKKQYDAAFVRWNSSYQSNLLTIRRVMRVSRFSSFEAYIDGGLSHMFRALDDCLTSSYDVRIVTNSAELSKDKMIQCGALKRLKPARDCSYEITGGLFELVNSERQDSDLIAEVDQRINSKCKASL